MPQFLIIYNQQTAAVDVTPYTDDQRAVARERRFELERDHRLEPHIEVVLLSAPSVDVVRRTHARYFKSVHELVESALG
jgi:hypothetical protein